jgi:hypothetical protein
MQQDVAAGAAGMLCLVLLVFLVVFLGVYIAYLMTLSKALSRVSQHNRLMEPGLVWLLLVPCVNIIWQFFVAIRLPDSLRNEFRERGRDDGSDYGKSIALTNAILGLVGGGISNVMNNAKGMEKVGLGISLVLGLVNLVLFIVFWVKIANYSNQLATDEGYGDEMRRRFDRYGDDDRGRPGPSAPDTYRPDDGDKPPESYRPDDERYTP